MLRLQQTIKHSAKISGVGLHTGKEVSLTFHPAPVNHGIVFRRIDLPESPSILANVEFVADTLLGTTLKSGNVIVQTVEHVLAALTGLQIDNILIDINNPEPPIMDGSSQDFVRILKAAGIEAQKSPINPIIIDDTYTFSDPLNDVFIQISPSDKFEVFVEVDYNSSITPPQSAHLSYIEEFDTKIADSRTFCFLRDVLQLHQMGLVKGGSPQNAIVIVDGSEKEADLQQLAAIYKIPYATISKGFLQTKLRHENEMAKHKLLDIIGDLTLVGAPIIGKVTAIRPGHRANTELAKIILANTLVKAG